MTLVSRGIYTLVLLLAGVRAVKLRPKKKLTADLGLVCLVCRAMCDAMHAVLGRDRDAREQAEAASASSRVGAGRMRVQPLLPRAQAAREVALENVPEAERAAAVAAVENCEMCLAEHPEACPAAASSTDESGEGSDAPSQDAASNPAPGPASGSGNGF